MSILSAAALAAALVTGSLQAQAPAPAATPAAAPKAAVESPAKPVSLEEALAFLPDVVAEVNGKKVMKKEVVEMLSKARVPAAMVQDPQFRAQLAKTVEGMAWKAFILEEAEAAGFKPSEEEAGKAVAEQLKSMPKETLDKLLAQEKKDVAGMIANYAKNPEFQQYVAFQKFGESVFRKSKDAVTDAEIDKFYAEHKEEEMHVSETIKASHILIRTAMLNPKDGKYYSPEGVQISTEEAKKLDEAAMKKIESIKAQLDKGANFGKLADQNTDDPSGKGKQGVIPVAFQRGMVMLPPEFDKAAFELQKVGEVSGIVKTDLGYHLIKLAEKVPGRYLDIKDAKLRGEIRDAIANDASMKSFTTKFEQLKKDGKVKINLSK